MLGWEKFVTLKVDHIYSKLVHLFFANIVVDVEIFEITNDFKGHMIMLNEQYISKWHNLRLSGPKVFSRNQLMTVIHAIITECQLFIVFGL